MSARPVIPAQAGIRSALGPGLGEDDTSKVSAGAGNEVRSLEEGLE